MEALKAELAAQRERSKSLKQQVGGGKKFVRRGEINAVVKRQTEEKRRLFEEERLERQRARERDSRGGAELNERLTKRPRSNQYGLVEGAPDEARGDNEGSNNEQSAASANSNGDMLPVDEVKARLRALGQPITYFAESDKERYDRLQQVETDSVVDDEFTIGGGHGTRNIFLEQDSRRANDDYEEEDDDDDDDEDDEIPNDNYDGSSNHKKDINGGQRIEKDRLSEDKAANGTKKSNVSSSSSSSSIIAAQSDNLEEVEDHRLVREYFKGLLREWELELQARPDHMKRTAAGKIETKTQKQAKDYIRPLFKLCKKREVPTDILQNLVLIMGHMKGGEFVKANDAYILTAIGNAAWPIGVTSVGIHQRTADDKMQTGKLAHVMNNKSQRKYLRSVKRLMRFEQNRRKDAAPSKKVQ